MNTNTKRLAALVSSVCAVALMADVASAQTSEGLVDGLKGGSYLSGDFHNHTTCTDGAMSVQTVVSESLITYDLDWFSQTGHGGSGSRDCRFNDPEFDASGSGEGALWTETIGQEGIKGDVNGGDMWRWQSLTEYTFPLQQTVGAVANEPVWLGLEHNAPGHEHVSMSILNGQFGARASGYRMGQFEYLWDRGDRDSSGGEENKFESPRNRGVAKTFGDETGLDGREKSVRAVAWMRKNFRKDSYYVPAHVERQGGFTKDANNGWNVEDFRTLHNTGRLAPRKPLIDDYSIVPGAEMLAGHQFANGGRGTYEADRPTSGFGTYGGAGAYSGAEVSLPGKDFDGAVLTNARLTEIRGELNAKFDNQFTEPSGSDAYDELDAANDAADPAPAGVGASPLERLVLGRPGIHTMWDSMLSEGRKFFNFGSSDWHNRGSFGPFEPQSTLDPWPGEYNKVYIFAGEREVARGKNDKISQELVDNLILGNSWSVMGDLIDSFSFALCGDKKCATMGENLDYKLGKDGSVTLKIKLRDPEGANNAPYTFNNPSLLQVGVETPLNQPKLDHVDIIRGDVTGEIDPSSPDFTSNTNPTTEIYARIDREDFTVEGEYLTYELTIPAGEIENSMYFRVRGTNIPVGTPNETDADGNPLLDDHALLIKCEATGAGVTDADVANATTAALASTGNSALGSTVAIAATFDPTACPAHLPVDSDGVKRLDADVEAWSDLWFYGNPIWIKVREGRKLVIAD